MHPDALPFIPPENVEIPENIDWRELGAVTRVKNQLGCGSCYAFSVIGALEGQFFRSTGKLTELSELDLTICGMGKFLDAWWIIIYSLCLGTRFPGRERE